MRRHRWQRTTAPACSASACSERALGQNMATVCCLHHTNDNTKLDGCAVQSAAVMRHHNKQASAAMACGTDPPSSCRASCHVSCCPRRRRASAAAHGSGRGVDGGFCGCCLLVRVRLPLCSLGCCTTCSGDEGVAAEAAGTPSAARSTPFCWMCTGSSCCAEASPACKSCAAAAAACTWCAILRSRPQHRRRPKGSVPRLRQRVRGAVNAPPPLSPVYAGPLLAPGRQLVSSCGEVLVVLLQGRPRQCQCPRS